MLNNMHLCGIHSHMITQIHGTFIVQYSEVEQSTSVNRNVF
jgi:hypothetical protein